MGPHAVERDDDQKKKKAKHPFKLDEQHASKTYILCSGKPTLQGESNSLGRGVTFLLNAVYWRQRICRELKAIVSDREICRHRTGYK